MSININEIIVSTQSELDALYENDFCGKVKIIATEPITITKPLKSCNRDSYNAINVCGDSEVLVSCDTTIIVNGYDNASITAYFCVSIHLYNNAKAFLYDSSYVETTDNSIAIAYNMAEVIAYDNSTVILNGSSTCNANDNSSVTMYHYSHCKAHTTGNIDVYDFATLINSGLANITLHNNGQSFINDFKSITIAGNSRIINNTGIDMSKENMEGLTFKGKANLIDNVIYMPNTLKDYIDFYEIEIKENKLILYKVINKLKEQPNIGNILKNDNLMYKRNAVATTNFDKCNIYQCEADLDNVTLSNDKHSIFATEFKILRIIPKDELGIEYNIN